MDVIGIIPARYGSTRLQAKALANILGTPMIQHIYERAKKAPVLDDVIVATDDERIKKIVDDFGGKAVLTSKEHTSGTERLTEVIFDLDVKIIVNIQGDEPLIQPAMINDVAYALLENQNLVMATLSHKITNIADWNRPSTQVLMKFLHYQSSKKTVRFFIKKSPKATKKVDCKRQKM